ncbi:MAG: hypothetical protein US60_C0005G0032 [Microgenomates group bacterium GW2011_GWC1_37_8]|uniref:Uncharacterized protein n=1 Tax=Candidatus Woesebacteria bacterium GW2011_GWB1_38_8 TaxID=1618570 RepID=A0A0G0LEB3_9BACT|nr:MAG: hypothetical protein US60_C0005G0032 [Microgenomates group bacterium GW2011_GWC1_37_8]KKQ86270.1 MAG: hypothetical protein UT08_C0001G0136 [Candidatus Woesebacteria bacterium GW2011_GWB1_38_8]
MTDFQKKVASAIAAGAILFNTALPVLAQSTSLVVTGNGADSDNDVNLSQQTTTTVVQNNVANISNNVDADADTGGNDANYNTGGSVSVKTGDASTGVGISNTANSNVAEIEGCCATDVDVELSGNGYNSDNTANLKLENSTDVFQTNYAKIKNEVDADSDTGDNDANYNTGGSVSIETGDADTTVLIENKANSNSARIGSGGGNGSISLRILGNGADSDNDINLAFKRSLVLTQDNLADIRNKVDADADTGNNDANYNTGGAVGIDTGDASVGVGIDNMANFNSADLNCGCLLNVLAKIAGNGYNSDNDINAALLDAKVAFQNNAYICGHGYPYPGNTVSELSYGGYHKKACNDVDADADTGDNDVKKNTGDPGVDPSIETGDAATLVEIQNTANANVLTEGGGLDLPELPDFEWDFDFGFNWSLWGWLVGLGS